MYSNQYRKRYNQNNEMQQTPLSQQIDINKKEESVWPPDVESAFIKALESIPNLGRRKVLVNGKPCGRNELISEFIFRKTSKVRTRKQVSSHIQVLKNTRKNDPYFMKLLMDVDIDPITLLQEQKEANELTINSISISNKIKLKDNHLALSTSKKYMSPFDAKGPYPVDYKPEKSCFVNLSLYCFWPSNIIFYLESKNSNDSVVTLQHKLATLFECKSNLLPTLNLNSTKSTNIPIYNKYLINPSIRCLLANVNLDMNVKTSDCSFSNTSFFETKERRTIECTTVVYSFEKPVLETKEIQQALWLNTKRYVYNFLFANQFFEAFFLGLDLLKTWQEIDAAIENLCVVQSFLDVESKLSSSSQLPLLVILYQFKRGEGSISLNKIIH